MLSNLILNSVRSNSVLLLWKDLALQLILNSVSSNSVLWKVLAFQLNSEFVARWRFPFFVVLVQWTNTCAFYAILHSLITQPFWLPVMCTFLGTNGFTLLPPDHRIRLRQPTIRGASGHLDQCSASVRNAELISYSHQARLPYFRRPLTPMLKQVRLNSTVSRSHSINWGVPFERVGQYISYF